MKFLPVLLPLAVAACGYNPPPHTDTAAPAYIAARDTCEDASVAAVNKVNAKTGLAWFTSPFLRWNQIKDATGSCMEGKGYGQLRWCTPEELRDGTKQGDRVVTASGVQCSDPPTRK